MNVLTTSILITLRVALLSPLVVTAFVAYLLCFAATGGWNGGKRVIDYLFED